KPVDDITVPKTPLHTVLYLTVTTPHLDDFAVYGPYRTFAALMPHIETTVSASPSAYVKLSALSADPSFKKNGFTTFTIDLERGAYTVLRILRETNEAAYNILPAPVHLVSAAGPLYYDMGTALRTVASGRPKGVAKTSRLVGSYIDVVSAQTAAKQAMDELVKDAKGVVRTEQSEPGGKRRWVLLGMNDKAVWKVMVEYDDEVVKHGSE
ncbi:hypothetical protein K504DRAFT_341642, partial [Pleomassaria siparia CBS 279.74]